MIVTTAVKGSGKDNKSKRQRDAQSKLTHKRERLHRKESKYKPWRKETYYAT